MDRSSVLVATSLVVGSVQKKSALLGATITFDKGFSPIFKEYLCKVGLYLRQTLDNSQWPAAVVEG
jgi:hypothetical protein